MLKANKNKKSVARIVKVAPITITELINCVLKLAHHMPTIGTTFRILAINN